MNNVMFWLRVDVALVIDRRDFLLPRLNSVNCVVSSTASSSVDVLTAALFTPSFNCQIDLGYAITYMHWRIWSITRGCLIEYLVYFKFPI